MTYSVLHRWSFCAIFCAALSNFAFAQTASMTTSGNWNTATNWNASNIGDLVTETVTINNNVNPTVINGTSFTVGNTTLANNNTLTINGTGTLNVGNSTNSRNMTTNNNANITVAGTLIIWGNLVVNNNIVWNITGTVIIKGNVSLSNNANINVSGGNLTIDGNFTGSNNNNVNVPSGSITVGGSVNIGNGSNLNGCTGCFHLNGSCTGPGSFCGGTALPVTFEYFRGSEDGTSIRLEWATLTEVNFDYFVLEHSTNGTNNQPIATIHGHGNSTTRNEYHFVHDAAPAGSNYYRLKAVDYDLSEEYFATILVKKSISGRKLLVHPNPVRNLINVDVNFDSNRDGVIEIFNHLGAPIGSYAAEGRTTSLPLSPDLPSGLYWLRYRSASETMNVQFVVSHE